MRFRQASVLPGFGLAFGYTVFYLGLVVLLPLSALIIKTSSLTFARFYEKAFEHFIGLVIDLNFNSFFEITSLDAAH